MDNNFHFKQKHLFYHANKAGKQLINFPFLGFKTA